MNRYLLILIGAMGMFLSYGEKKNSECMKNCDNPFYAEYNTPYGVPPFDLIKFEHFRPAFEAGIKCQASQVEKIATSEQKPTFENTVLALEHSGELLDKVSTVFFNYMSALTDDSMQMLAKEMAPILSSHTDNIFMNAKLFERIKEVYKNKDELKGEDFVLLDKTYKNFVKQGANLSEDKKARLREINKELGILTLQFGENVLNEVNRYKLWIDDEKDLSGLPQSVVDAARVAAKAEGKNDSWLFTVNRSSSTPFLQYADNRELRKQMYLAYINKGNYRDSLDNNENITRMLNLRNEKAVIFGYPNYSALALHDRMSKTPENVYALLDKLWEPALKVAKKEAADMKKMIKKEGGEFELAGWDWWYYAEKIRKERYDLSDEDIRPYFKLENVEAGAFEVANKLWGLEFKQVTNLPLFHPDARTFEVRESDGTLIGILYADYHPRKSKAGGAWMTSYREQSYKNGERVIPVISTTCNFTMPTADKPALLSLDEVETLFHEFGHCLHGLLSDCKYSSLSGTSVARDFVELPSQVMEHWATHPEVLKFYAKHYDTGEVMPDELIAKIEKSSQFNQGFRTTEYLAAALLDMDYHTTTSVSGIDPQKFEEQVLAKRNLMPQIVSRYRSTYFNHIFSGGYSSGYYSYIWAEVLDSDAFAAFQEKGDIFDADLAKKFREHILERGGTVDEGQMYRNFRGQDPNPNALLKNRGLL